MAASEQGSVARAKTTVQVRNFDAALWHQIRVRALEHKRSASAELEHLVLQGLEAARRNGCGGSNHAE